MATEYAHHGSKRSRCKRCGKHWREVGCISWEGNCAPCGDRAMLENVAGLRAHTGEVFAHWRKRCLASFGITE
jgi:hypothetical protein